MVASSGWTAFPRRKSGNRHGHSAIYPRLSAQSFILKTVASEEESFGRTLIAGVNRFEQVSSTLGLQSGDTFPGEEMFRLYGAPFGLSKDLIADLATSRRFGTDPEAYKEAMNRQRTQSKASSKFGASERETLDIYQQVSPQPTEFLGYDYSLLDDGRQTTGDGSGAERHTHNGSGKWIA